jgi:hypothetical protein
MENADGIVIVAREYNHSLRIGILNPGPRGGASKEGVPGSVKE